MEMRIKFPGNKRVSAEFEGFTVMTDQPNASGGDGSAPAPFDLFLASLGTCAGIFVLNFCRRRNISTEGLGIIEKIDWDEAAHRVSKIALEILLPENFPEKYRESVIATASLCTVKKHIHEPPAFEITATTRAQAAR